MATVEGASADFADNEEIKRGDGYQINNYVIEVTDVFLEADSATFRVYDEDEEIDDPMLDINDSFSFDFEDEGEVEVTLNSVFGGNLNRANISISLSDYDKDLHTKKVINGGHDEADFAGTPIINITKTVDNDTVKVGDNIRIRVEAQNTGDDKAIDVEFSNSMQENFVLEETIIEKSGPMSIDEGETETVYIYELSPAKSGEFDLKPTTATFSNEADQDFPKASSNTPTITVEQAEKNKAELNINTEADSFTLPRGETVTSTINIKNTGKASAEAVQIDIDIPDGMEYLGGDDEIEIIDGAPTVYMENLGQEQEKEISFKVKANEIGTYNLATQLSYNNGADDEKITSESTTKDIRVKEGKFDFLLNQPIYVYVLPILVIIGVGGWVYYKHREYKF
ncbi:BatD family protein [Methanohalobium evestigatum]|uniref:BatD family protein n=1 Tax=Methanohalobium evestigatum TaxID=2322 RepID=UPI0018DEC424|nr:BatD family protein [Methanohalobium evestigatum]